MRYVIYGTLELVDPEIGGDEFSECEVVLYEVGGDAREAKALEGRRVRITIEDAPAPASADQ